MKKPSDQQAAYIVTLERDGKTTPQAILADAKVPDSPLHDLYDWDIAAAAEQHWLARTRQILRQVQVIVHTETMSYRLPRYVRDPEAPAREQGYASIEHLRIDPSLGRRALIAEFGRVTSALRRARAIAVGLAMDEDIDSLLASVAGLQAIVRAGADATDGPSATIEATH